MVSDEGSVVVVVLLFALLMVFERFFFSMKCSSARKRFLYLSSSEEVKSDGRGEIPFEQSLDLKSLSMMLHAEFCDSQTESLSHERLPTGGCCCWCFWY